MKWVTNSLHWCHRMFWYSFAAVAIVLAIAISLIRVFITDVKDYRQEIESFASSMLEQEVRIDSMDAKLSGFTPLIVFKGVRMLNNSGTKQLLRFDEARLTIDPIRSLTSLKLVPKGFTVYGVSLGINRKKEGTLQIQDLNLAELGDQISFETQGVNTESTELADWLFNRSELAIKNSTVIWQDAGGANKPIKIQNVNFYIRNDNERHQVTGTVTLPAELGQDFAIALDFKGNLLNPKEWRGDYFVKGTSLKISNWNVKPVLLNAQLQSGTVDVSMWGEWRDGTIQAFSADFTANAFHALIGESQQSLSIHHLGGLVNWRRTINGWLMNIDRFVFDGESGAWPQTRLQFEYARDENKREQIKAYASYFRLQDASDLLSRTQILPENIKSRILKLNPQGELKNLIMHSSLDEQHPEYRLSGELYNVHIDPLDKFPGVKNLSGVISANETGGHATLSVHDGDLEMPGLFRQPIALSSMDARVDWWHAQQQWVIKSSDLQLTNEDVSGSLSMLLLLPDKQVSPYLDLQLDYRNGQGKSINKYLPVTIMHEELVAWLDRAFNAGNVSQGGFVFHGRLADYPFAKRNGSMLAEFDVRDVLLDYQAGWPKLMINNGHVVISGLGLQVEGMSGKFEDSALNNVYVKLENFALPSLDIKGVISGQTRDMAHFMVNSPIAKAAAGIYRQAKIDGEVSGKVDLQIPLSKQARARMPLNYTVQATLNDSRVDLWDNKLVFEHISGDVTYKPKQITSKGLKGTLLDQNVAFKLFSRAERNSEEMLLSMRGKLDAGKIRQHVQSPVLEKISGITPWQGVLSLGVWSSEGHSKPGYFHFSSPLQGVAVDLPAPLTKSAEVSKPFAVQVEFPKRDVLPLFAKFAGDWSTALAINLNNDASRLLQKGSIVFLDEQAKLPEKDELQIKGVIANLPITQWNRLIEEADSMPLFSVTDLKLPVQLDLDHLKIVSEQDDTNKKAYDPRKFSLVNGEIRKLEYNAMKIGTLNLRTLREADGLRIDKISVTGEHMSLSGDGRWTLRDGKQLTNMLLKVTSQDFGALLADLDFAATLKKGEFQSVIQAHWHDMPTNYSLAILNADVGAVINDGVITQVEPGAGRLLGLLSLSELPRRLSLDFKELQNGLAFKQMIGQVEISNGNTHIGTMKIISPVALMQIEGSTNLVDKTFNQTVRVVPNVSGTVPFVSFLAYGGQIGAIAFVFDQIFGDTFDSAVGTKYRVTGTWENPQIVKIEAKVPEESPDIYDN